MYKGQGRHKLTEGGTQREFVNQLHWKSAAFFFHHDNWFINTYLTTSKVSEEIIKITALSQVSINMERKMKNVFAVF